MTFNELEEIFELRVLSESYEGVLTNAEVLNLLTEASVEIASALEFPRDRVDLALTLGGAVVELPADAGSVRIKQVLVDDWPLQPATFAKLRAARGLPNPHPRFYFYSPSHGRQIELGPPPSQDVTVRVEYVKILDASSMTGSTEVWDGLFANFHHIVVYKAGVMLYEALNDYERASYFLQRFQGALQPLVNLLGVDDLAEGAPMARLLRLAGQQQGQPEGAPQ